MKELIGRLEGFCFHLWFSSLTKRKGPLNELLMLMLRIMQHISFLTIVKASKNERVINSCTLSIVAN